MTQRIRPFPGNFTMCQKKVHKSLEEEKCKLEKQHRNYPPCQVALVVKNLPANTGDARDVGSKGQPTPVFLPGGSHGQRSLVGYTVHGVAES